MTVARSEVYAGSAGCESADCSLEGWACGVDCACFRLSGFARGARLGYPGGSGWPGALFPLQCALFAGGRAGRALQCAPRTPPPVPPQGVHFVRILRVWLGEVSRCAVGCFRSCSVSQITS